MSRYMNDKLMTRHQHNEQMFTKIKKKILSRLSADTVEQDAQDNILAGTKHISVSS
jgi:hypothetical protein